MSTLCLDTILWCIPVTLSHSLIIRFLQHHGETLAHVDQCVTNPYGDMLYLMNVSISVESKIGKAFDATSLSNTEHKTRHGPYHSIGFMMDIF